MLATSVALAEVKLPSVISDHMVLQRDMPLPIWGKAKPGEMVKVNFDTPEAAAATNDDGRWQVKLNAIQAGGPFEMTLAGENTITLTDILVGAEWVCSGQSNMQMTVSGSKNAEAEIAAADYPRIRLFTAERHIAGKPVFDVPGQWSACSPATVGDFSAVGYFFGRQLHEELRVPVGLIHSSWGGTPAESWTSLPVLEADPALKPIVDGWNDSFADFAKHFNHWREKRLVDWYEKAEQAEAQGRSIPKVPDMPKDWRQIPYRPAGLYNAMIAPLIPYGIKGAIWYQGESNAPRAYQYRTLFPAMIKDWRHHWGEGEFPFLFVQLANFKAQNPEPADDTWAELREAQTMTLSLPKTGMALAIDIGDAKDIHPKDKQEGGRRLSLAARAVA